MDLITHIFLGAAVGEIVLGKKAGNKAMLWGAIAGIVPDLDMLVVPFLETSRGLLVHRGITHSLLAIVLLSPLLGWIITRWFNKDPNLKPKHWSLLVFWSMLAHVVIDFLTSYGTGIFLPFSNGRYGVSTIAIVDVFFSLPLVACVIIRLFLKPSKLRRTMVCWIGILLSLLYVSYTIVNKAYVNSVFEKTLFEQKIKYYQVKTFPQPPTNFTWMGIARTADGSWIGYYNQLNPASIEFRFIPRNDYLLIEHENLAPILRIKRFAKGVYSIERSTDGEIRFNVLRFGQAGAKTDNPFVMSLELKPVGNSVVIEKWH